MDNVKESYFGFKKFIENVTGLDENLENEYNNISTENIGGKNKLLDYFININLAEVNVDKNREIIKLIGDEFKFSTEQMKELIKTKRLYYDVDFWQQSIQNKLLKEYIIMCMTIDQGVFQDAFENLNVSLSLILKLEMIYLSEEEKLIKMIISKQDSKSGEELNKISEPNLHVISNKILNINPTKSFLLRLLTEIPYNAVKSDILGYLLDNSDKLDINSKELDTALDTTIFSKTNKKGTEYLSFEKYNVSKELINVLEERDLAIKRNNTEFSLKAGLSKLVKIV